MSYLTGSIIAIIVILIFYVHMNITTYDRYIGGLWLGCEKFCESAEIDQMMLYIGKSNISWLGKISREFYLVITGEDGDVICNQGGNLSYRHGWGGAWIGPYTINARYEFEGDNDIWADQTSDGKIKITVDIARGLMRICAGDVLLAKLYKSNELSEM